MSDVLYFNGRFTTTDERVLTVEDRGFLFGDAVYEVFKFLRHRPLFLTEHWQRLARGLEEIEIRNPWDEASFREAMAALLKRTEFDDGIVYIEVSRGEGERVHAFRSDMTPNVVAFSRRHKFPDAAAKERGIRLLTTRDRRWKHCDVKSVNLLANIVAKTQAVRAGADEALLVDEGLVRECSHSSFFAVIGGRIVTHPLDEHILPGVTRHKVIELARSVAAIDERPILVTELDEAEELFVTSTSLAVMPVRQVDEGENRVRGPITARLQAMLDQLEAAG